MCPQLTKQYSTFKFFHRSLIFVCLLSAELVPLLLESGASLEARNKDKATPLDSSHNKQVIFDSAYLHTVAFFLFRERSGAGGVTWPLLIIWWLKFVCAFEFITFQNSHYIIPLRFNFCNRQVTEILLEAQTSASEEQEHAAISYPEERVSLHLSLFNSVQIV